MMRSAFPSLVVDATDPDVMRCDPMQNGYFPVRKSHCWQLWRRKGFDVVKVGDDFPFDHESASSRKCAFSDLWAEYERLNAEAAAR